MPPTRIRETPLPEPVLAALVEEIEKADDASILDVAGRIDPSLGKGLRINRQNAPKIRKRLLARVRKEGKIAKRQVELLADFFRPLAFLEDFTEATIEDLFDKLCAVHGQDRMVASLLLDWREEMNRLAEQVISGERKVKPLPEKEKRGFATVALRHFDPFFSDLREAEKDREAEKEKDSEKRNGSVEGKKKPAVSAETEKLRKRIQTLEKQLEEVRKERKEYKSKAAKLVETRTALKKAERSSKQWKKRANDLANALDETRKELETLDAAIAMTVDERLHSELNRWLLPAERLEAESRRLAEAKSGDLLARAKSVIKRQQEIDRHAGNRRTLLLRLEELEEARSQIDDLSIESINPLQELEEVAIELEREIRAIRNLLKMEEEASPVAKALQVQIGRAATPEELAGIKDLLEEIDARGLLPPEETHNLFDHCDERTMLLYARHVPKIGKAAPPPNPLHQLRHALAEGTPLLWLIDGHNILGRQPELFGSIGNADARAALAEFAVERVRNAPACELRLYFDGPEYTEHQPAPNARIIYSGGEGKHRADQLICGYLEFARKRETRTPALLATDDHELRRQARKLGASIMTTNDFHTLARAYRKRTAG